MTSRVTANQIAADDLLDVTGATITGLSHVSLDDIGTNTHAQLDTHVGSTANPHAVTKAQVGLGNVPDVDCTDASNIASGTLDEARLPSSVAKKLENVLTVAVSGGDYTSVQTAVNAAGADDIVEIAPGTYTENVTITGAVALRGACGCRAVVAGKITVSAAAPNTVSLLSLGVEATNAECVEMTGTGTLRISQCRLDGTWTSGAGQTTSTSKSLVKITAGTVSVGDSTQLVVDAAGDDTAEHNTSAYWVSGSAAVRLESFSCEHDVANTTDTNQNLEVMFCNNTNASTFVMIKNGWCTLTGVANPLNYAAPFYMFNSAADARIDGNVVTMDSTGHCYTAFHSAASSVTFFTNNVVFPTNVADEYLAYESGTGSIHCATNVWNSATMPSVFGDVDHITSLADGTTVSSGSNRSVGADAGSERVTNVATPLASHDAVTKLYADSLPPVHPDRTFVVSPSGGSHTTIAAAIAAANALVPPPSVTDPVTIMVAAGTYTEANPLTIPVGTCVRGQAGFPTVQITPTTTTQPVFQMQSNTFLAYLWILGANGSGGCAVRFLAGSVLPMCQLVRVEDCETAFDVIGPGTVALGTQICGTRMSAGTSMNEFIRVSSGAQFVVCTARVFSASPLIPIARGVHITGAGSLLNANDIQMRNCTEGALVENGASGNRAVLRMASAIVRLTTSDAIEIGAYSDVYMLATDVESTSGNELSLTASTSRVFGTGNRVRADKIVRVFGASLSMLGVSTEPEFERSYVIGDGGFSVGTHDIPAPTAMGAGGPHTHNVRVFTETPAAVFTDRTAAALLNDGTTFPMFDGTAVGNRFWVGFTDIAAARGFPGIEVVDISTALVHGGTSALAWEYWNGTTASWTEFQYMAAKATPDFWSRARVGAFAYVESQHVRFGRKENEATTTVNGVAGWWLRVTVTTGALATAPVADQIKLHADTRYVSEAGYGQYFGRARPRAPIWWDAGLLEPANSSPSNQDVYVSDRLNVGRRENLFAANTTDRCGMNSLLPPEIDTSFPIRAWWSWRRDSNDSVTWVVRWGYTYMGDGPESQIYTSSAAAPTTGPNEQSTTITVPAGGAGEPQAGEQINSSVDLDVFDMIAEREGDTVFGTKATGDTIWLCFERPNQSGADCALINLGAHYVKAADGGYIDG